MMGESASQASYISSQEVGGESGSSPACSNRSLFQYKVIWGSTSSGKAYHCPWYWLTSLEISLTLSSTAPSNRSSSGISVPVRADRKSTRLKSSHVAISYAVFCL